VDEIRSGGTKVFHDCWVWRRSASVNPSSLSDFASSVDVVCSS
jgi:hypothetical protein